ncbi:MAG: 2-C-methyl-D-erythritol 2,4-cyclodiphosphate synthase [Clostridia bacterium]|nr:2-C-methyl-D-erythritol 2,4-cyclodiphosphate synthase [Clostridia bacterium]
MVRVGIGYDVHRLVEGRKLILGGVEIPFELGLLGYSDADVLVHAIMDAMLGACALGDIGLHFPDTDERYKGVSSIELLKEVNGLIKVKGYCVNNIDAVLVAQKPKIQPFIYEMRKNIAEALGIDASLVSVKATTTEGLGFEGSMEGISAQSIVSLENR